MLHCRFVQREHIQPPAHALHRSCTCTWAICPSTESIHKVRKIKLSSLNTVIQMPAFGISLSKLQWSWAFNSSTGSLIQLPPVKNPKPRSRVCFSLLFLAYPGCCQLFFISIYSAQPQTFLDASLHLGCRFCKNSSVSNSLLGRVSGISGIPFSFCKQFSYSTKSIPSYLTLRIVLIFVHSQCFSLKPNFWSFFCSFGLFFAGL